MANKRLLAIVTALMLATGTHGAFATYTHSQLEQIEQFLRNGNFELLKEYLDNNPELLDGSDALTVQLQDFAAAVESAGSISEVSTLSFAPSLDVVASAKDSY